MAQPSLSLCMIVKNEADQLPRCLKSVAGLADEIIVADTGSSDDTCAIARTWGARIFSCEWQDDFAAARNFALQQAGGTWILCLDADEELDPSCHGLIKELIQSQEMEGYFGRLVCPAAPAEKWSGNTYPVFRLFRNRPLYRFNGRVHESILESLLQVNSPSSIAYTAIRIIHYGYLADIWRAKGKSERNLRLIQRDLAEYGPSALRYYYLGNEYYQLGEYQKALANYRLAERIDNGGAHSQLSPLLVRSHLNCLLMLGSWREMLQYIETKLPKYPDYTDLYLREGYAWLQLNQPDKAFQCFTTCLKLGEVGAPHYSSTVGTGTHLPWHYIGVIYRKTGRPRLAWQALSQNIRANPSQESFWEDLRELFTPRLLDWEEQQDNIRGLLETLHLDDGSKLTFIKVFSSFGFRGLIGQILKSIKVPVQATLFDYLAGCSYQQEGKYNEAFACFKRIDAATHPNYHRLIAMRQLEQAWITGDYPAANSLLNDISGLAVTHEDSDLLNIYQHLHGLFGNAQNLPSEVFANDRLFANLINAIHGFAVLAADGLVAKISAAVLAGGTPDQVLSLLETLLFLKKTALVKQALPGWSAAISSLSPIEAARFLRLKNSIALSDCEIRKAINLLRQMGSGIPGDGPGQPLQLITLLKNASREVVARISSPLGEPGTVVVLKAKAGFKE